MWNLTFSFGLVAVLASFAIVALPANRMMQTAELVHWTGDTRAPTRDRIDRTPREMGELLMRRNGCFQCHSVDGSTKVGPSLKGVYGAVRMFGDGTSRLADEGYLRESILEPNRHIVEGFAPGMPGFGRSLRERELDLIIAYLQTLNPVTPESSNSGAPD